MTDGRFDSSYNMRGPDFERRPFWADSHKLKNVQELKEAESCPYHDLRADGCFMPHRGDGISGGKGVIRAEQLVTRPNGSPMKTALSRSKGQGCGGALLCEDTDPLPVVSPPKRNAAPWTSTGKSKMAFSTPPYISAPDRPKPAQEYEPPFHTGASGSKGMGQPFEYVPDQPRPRSPPTTFRLKAGTYKALHLPVVLSPSKSSPSKGRGMTQSASASSPSSSIDGSPKKKKAEFKPRERFQDKKTLQGTFGRVAEHLPTPYEEAKLNDHRGGPLFTYWAKTKRTAPVEAQWDSAPNAVRVG